MKNVATIKVVLVVLLSMMLLQNCIPYLSESGQPCPCKEGWKCCTGATGEDLCVPKSGELVAGEIVLSSDRIPTSGHLEAEIVVWAFETLCENRPPVEKLDITIQSSRNQDSAWLDLLEQPTGPTDADGRVVAFLGSGTPGESVLTVLMGNAELCKTWNSSECVEPVQAVVTFDP